MSPMDSLLQQKPSVFSTGSRQTEARVIELPPGSNLQAVAVVMETSGGIALVQVTFTSGGSQLVIDLQPQRGNYNNWISRASTDLSHDWQWYGNLRVPLRGQSYLSYQSVINRTGSDVRIIMAAQTEMES